MKLDRRDILRPLEDRLLQTDMPEPLITDLVRYYFDKNVYSRCNIYLAELGNELNFGHRMLMLKIAIGERDDEIALPLLNDMLNESPAHPGLLTIASKIHFDNGNEAEAKEFAILASQVDPIHFPFNPASS